MKPRLYAQLSKLTQAAHIEARLLVSKNDKWQTKNN